MAQTTSTQERAGRADTTYLDDEMRISRGDRVAVSSSSKRVLYTVLNPAGSRTRSLADALAP